VATFEGLSQMGKIDSLKRPLTPSKIGSSLNQFTERLINSGEFQNMVTSYVKDDSKLDPKQFKLFTHKGYDHNQGPVYNTFQYDGSASLLLFYGDPNDRIGAVASIEMFQELINRHKSYNQEMDTSKISSDDIIINQIRGPFKEDAKKIHKTFSNFRWEKLLVEIFIEWARQAGLQKIFMLPSALNPWAVIKNNIHGSSFLRFDVTAKRLGFRRQKDNEPYMLAADDSTKKLFGTIFEKVNS
jgi:hypothetical protein